MTQSTSTVSLPLRHRHILIGVTGGIAAYKTCELVRRLQDQGATIQIVMTEAATRFVTPTTFQALSGRPVYTSAWESPEISGPGNAMPHIDLTREADLIVVAPASADFIARLASGQCNDLLTTLCSAREIPLLIAPAMNRQMWTNPANQRAVAQVQQDGAELLGPGSGAQACGEVGDGRMLEPDQLVSMIIDVVSRPSAAAPVSTMPNIRGVLQGKSVLITAGPTFEPIDPVRGMTNRSSGKMGFAIAQAAQRAGAHVTLIAGPVHLATPDQVKRIDVMTALQMFEAVMSVQSKQPQDIFIGVAAVADWRPAQPATGKIKKETGGDLRTVEWLENPDILATVAGLSNPPYCVGFAAETGTANDLRERLPAKRVRKHVPLIVGNIGPDTFGADDNELLLCDEHGCESVARADKHTLAQGLIFSIAQRLGHEGIA